MGERRGEATGDSYLYAEYQVWLTSKIYAMSGKRLLDAAAVLKASRGVASQLVALRKSQLDVYSKTSSLAHAVRSQTDRVTLTAKAASALSNRLNDTSPQSSFQAPAPNASDIFPPTTSEGKDPGTSDNAPRKQSIELDHFDVRSTANAGAEAARDETLHTGQERANRYPLPDGTIPPAESLSDALRQSKATITLSPDRAKRSERQSQRQIPSETAEPPRPISLISELNDTEELSVSQDQDIFYTPPQTSGQVHSTLPYVKLPKNTEGSQGSDRHVADDGMNQDVFYSSTKRIQSQARPAAQTNTEQEDISDDSYSELFHSPRIANMLRGGPKKFSSPKSLTLAGKNGKPNEETKSEQQDQISPHVQYPSADTVATADISVHELAADVAKEVDASKANGAQVIMIKCSGKIVLIADTDNIAPTTIQRKYGEAIL